MFINSLKDEDRGKELEFMRPLHEEDIIKTSHVEFMTQDIHGGKTLSKGKINSVCDALKEEFIKINDNNQYLLPILTTYIKKEPQELK